MTGYHDRLTALRVVLAEQQVDGFVLTPGDEHLSEFPVPYAARLLWLTGFAGSTASVAVLTAPIRNLTSTSIQKQMEASS